MAMVQLRVSGCIGGHTGIDIHKGHANAIQILARLLDATRQFSFGIVEMNGGNAPNAIPRDSHAVLVLSTERFQEWKLEIVSTMESIKKEFIGIEREDQGMKCEISTIQPTTSTVEAANVASSHAMVDLLLTVPHGVIRNVPGLRDAVETSISLSLISYHKGISSPDDLKALENPFIVHMFTRSSSDLQIVAMERRLLAIARAFHAQCTPKFNAFPGWMPNMKSAALAKTIEAHKRLFISEPHIYSVHAGLECGFLQKAYPHIVCVSIGPTIENAHSPDERLVISSVLPFYQWLRETVRNCSNLVVS
jgi:dipeptidase D